MNTSEENEIKKEFQLERVIFFSDAVFAIIITIMVLDVKVPELTHGASEKATIDAFIELLPKLIAYIVSFFAIGNLWMRHLRIFSFLKDYNMTLVAINLLFLFSISLFPFALSFVFSNSHVMQYSWGAYTYIGLLYFTIFTQTLLVGYLVKNQATLCINSKEIDKVFKWKIRWLNFFAMPGFVLIVTCVHYFNLSQYVVYGAVAAYIILVRRLKKKYYPDEKKLTLASVYGNIRRAKPKAGKKDEQIA
jgi:uncharacterized membrane protein